ncbi:PGRP2 amidase, partial [Nothoprocta ornata]|nr:PGRP2 amidase [Nothoprocta ornata]
AAPLRRHVDTLSDLLEALEATNATAGRAGGAAEVARALAGGGTPLRRAVLGIPRDVAPESLGTLAPPQRALLAELLHPKVAERGVLLAPDGSSVAVAPLLAGLEVGLKRAAGAPVVSPDPLYAVTVAEVLATSYVVAVANGSRATLGRHGCWDDVEEPQVFTLAGPSWALPDALANGALDGVLLGARLAAEPAPLGALLRGYYGYGAAGERAPSSYRRGRFGNVTTTEKLEEEVVATLRLLRALPATRHLLEDLGDEEVAEVARRATRDFMDVYVECPPVVPRCMWGARPYRGTPSALEPPLASVYIHHTHEPGAPCRSFAACAGAMRAMQRFHQDVRGWDDIGYRCHHVGDNKVPFPGGWSRW